MDYYVDKMLHYDTIMSIVSPQCSVEIKKERLKACRFVIEYCNLKAMT